jgi:hypothetical protein
MVDLIVIDPYQQYINYLKYVVIYDLKREMSEALTSSDPSCSEGEDRYCKCSTCTCGHKKNNPLRKIGRLHLHHLHLHPHLGTTTCRRNTPLTLCSPGSSCTTRLIRNVVMKFLNSLRYVIST